MTVNKVGGICLGLIALAIISLQAPNLVTFALLLPGMVLIHLGSLMFPFGVGWERGVTVPLPEVIGYTAIGAVPLAAAVVWSLLVVLVVWLRCRRTTSRSS